MGPFKSEVIFSWKFTICWQVYTLQGFPGGSEVKASACNVEDWVRKIPWRRKWQPTPVFLPGGSHGQRSLVGYSPRGRKELDTTEQLHFHTLFRKTIFGCAGSSLLGRLFSSCSTWGLLSRQGLLTAVPSLVEHKLRSINSVVVAHGLRCPRASRIFPDQGLNLSLLHWHMDSLLLSHQGIPIVFLSTAAPWGLI